MKALVVTAVVLGALVVPAPAAQSAGRYEGGCQFGTIGNAVATGDVEVGYLAVRTVTTDSYVPPMPVLATVECTLEVNGVVQNSTDRLVVTGYGAQSGAQYATLTVGDQDVVEMCISVHYIGLAGAVDVQHDCGLTAEAQLPPWWTIETLDLLLDVVGSLSYAPDPVVCPLLASRAGTYGPYTIAPDGDVTGPNPEGLVGDYYYDCPPYVNPPPPASRSTAVYCPYGHVTGTATYSPALALDAATVGETFDLALSGCTSAPLPAGDYALHLAGTANDACVTTGLYPAAGTGSGTITGSGPNGAVQGTYAMTKHGVRYLVRGRFTSGGRSQVVDLWLDQQALCPPDPANPRAGGIASSGLLGEGVVLVDVPTP